jgi:hypothetical protein
VNSKETFTQYCLNDTISDEDYEVICRSVYSTKVKVHIQPFTQQSRKPTSMGFSVRRMEESIQRILATRIGIVYRLPASVKEQEIAAMSEDRLQKWLNDQKREHKSVYGLSYKCPSGCPPTRVIGRKILPSARQFNFTVELSQYYAPPSEKLSFTYLNCPVEDFTPCFYGGRQLKWAWNIPRGKKYKGVLLAFGFGRIAGVPHCFVKTQNGMTHYEANPDENHRLIPASIGAKDQRSTVLMWTSVRQQDPFDPMEFGVHMAAEVPGVRGIPSALYCYKGYQHSKQPGAFSAWMDIFRSCGCICPSTMRAFMLDYPQEPSESNIFRVGNMTTLLGDNCVHKLSLIYDATIKTLTKIDLSGNAPRIVQEVMGDF